MCDWCEYGMSYDLDLCGPGQHEWDEDGDCSICGATQTNDEFLNEIEE